jgi:hypothetical protein
MTLRKPLDELQRPNRALGELLRLCVWCPLCRGDVKAIAYRARTTRLECVDCSQRFSIPRMELEPGIDRERLRKELTAALMRRAYVEAAGGRV